MFPRNFDKFVFKVTSFDFLKTFELHVVIQIECISYFFNFHYEKKPPLFCWLAP